MVTEGEYIVNTFRTAFGQDRSKRICLYGTGKFTKLLLEKLEDFNIVGVADFGYEKTSWEGYRILLKKEVEERTDVLVLIANPANVHIVYKKVKELSKRIRIYTIEKKDVRAEEQFHKEADLEEALGHLRQYVVSTEDRKAFERFSGELLHGSEYEIRNVYSFINVFVAPWLISYFAWVVNCIRQTGAETVLFLSRDGYLFYKLFQLLPDCGALPEVKYFYTSRRCTAVASIENEQDIKVIAGQLYKGNNKNFLEERFGLKVSPNEEELLLGNEALALRYKKNILKNAAMERDCLEAYLQKEGIDKNKKILLFEFIGRGTIQYCLEKIIGKPLDCLYYFRVRDEGCIERERTEGVISYSGEGCIYSTKLFTQRNSTLFEAIVTAPHGMVERIGKDQAPVYSKKREADKSYFEDVERACVDYYREMYGEKGHMSLKEINLELADQMAGLLEYDCIHIDENVRNCFKVYDPYQSMYTNLFADGYIK